MTKDIPFASTTNMLILDGKDILLIKRDESLKEFPGWLMLPGGKQKFNETPRQAAIRETFEETGLKVKEPELKVMATHFHEYQPKVYLVYIFLAKKFSGKLIDREEDKGTPIWLSIKETLKHPKLYPDLRRHIGMIINSPKGRIQFTYHRFNSHLKIVETL